MTALLAFLLRHGYSLLFSAVLLEHLGVPLPAAPILLAVGALSRTGGMRLDAALGIVLIASLFGHYVWFEAGRRRGMAVLRLLCRISLEPDTCVRTTQELFQRRGASTVVLGHWVPGLATVAPPMAGMIGMSPARFLLLDAAGTLLRAGAYSGLGYLFGNQLEQVALRASQTGGWLFVVLGSALAAYVGMKAWQRQKIIRDVHMGRIDVAELKSRLDAGEPLLVIDLRHAAEGLDTLPGALRISAEELELRFGEIPTDREIVVACS